MKESGSPRSCRVSVGTSAPRFSAVVVEDSSSVLLPTELAEVWLGCGGSAGTSAAAVKLFVRWDVLGGTLAGP